ncbi:unnamed protein product (macronuclear) [Paramecium tetraurelia]|uniref:Uncharacterized protein n=1 Tax=Paramecium tetraurelia TaxID=5888 RepID=A0BEZ6_PARTE|nr:uncharacterized protein GSPATT00028148001 [Paramecium tetraurelia]CAK57113.1 unnamed protein product [Paramecium tetraurelia]|eukprot:XP_001424511.1 hypothetical protein (macronuclear) [Paramecium tetraurelia strain d4-2]
MNFSLKQRRTQSSEPLFDEEVFGELKNEKDFEMRLQQLSEIQHIHQMTQSSGISMSSGRSKAGKHQMVESYAYLIQEMVHNKELQQFCHQFGFSIQELEQYSSIEERQNFVIRAMCKHIKEQMQSLLSKVELRMHSYRVDEWNELQRMNKQNINIFEWLNVKSKYEHLRKKLQYALIDSITATQAKQQQEKRNRTFSQSNASQISRTSTTCATSTRRRQSSISEVITVNPKVQLVSQYKDFKTQWNEDLEKQYRLKGRSHKVLGLYPVIQKAILDNVGQSVWNQQRDRLLTKYTEGGCLTEEEVKFIATTSQLLNSCSDKEFLQKTISHLDKNIIDEIEFNIAECILATYTNISNEVKSIRQVWLKKIGANLEQQVKDTHYSVLRKMQLQKSQKELEKVKVKMVTVFKDLQRKHSLKLQQELDKDWYIQQQKGVNKVILKFKEKLMKKVKKYRNEKNLGITHDFITRNIPKQESLLFKINKEMKSTEFVQRLFHPPSKLIVKNPGSQTERAIKEEQKYKVRSSSTKRQSEFKRYLSGGPQTERQFVSKALVDQNQQKISGHKNPHEWITSEIEVTAINKIKAAIKAYLQRKKYQKQKQLKQEQEELKKNVLASFVKKNPERIERIELEVNNVIKSLTLNKQKSQSSIYSSKQRIQSDMKLKTRKLFQAAKKRCLNIAIQSGFMYTTEDANQKDELGRTPLSYAAENGDEAICNYLLKIGSNINIPSFDGMTPMHFVFKSNSVSLIMRFIQLGGNLNKMNTDGLTPVAFCNHETLKKLNLNQMISSSLKLGSFDNHSILNKKYPQHSDIIEALEFSGNFSKLQ